MSQMPDKIWLHKDTKYNTTDEVFGYQYESAQEIQSEGIENFIEYVPLDAFIDKTIEWFLMQLNEGDMECRDIEKFVANYKKYMEK